MKSLVELIDRLFGILFSGVAGLVSLLRGKNDTNAKKLPIYAVLAFLAVCVFQSLHALALAEREAAMKE